MMRFLPFAALALLASPLAAQPSVKVPLMGLMSQGRMAASMDERIERAVRVVCRPEDIRDPKAHAAARECRSEARASARAQLQSAHMRALQAQAVNRGGD